MWPKEKKRQMPGSPSSSSKSKLKPITGANVTRLLNAPDPEQQAIRINHDRPVSTEAMRTILNRPDRHDTVIGIKLLGMARSQLKDREYMRQVARLEDMQQFEAPGRRLPQYMQKYLWEHRHESPGLIHEFERAAMSLTHDGSPAGHAELLDNRQRHLALGGLLVGAALLLLLVLIWLARRRRTASC